MSISPTSIQEIQNYLNLEIRNAHIQFADLLSRAQSKRDIAQVKRLMEAVEPLFAQNPYLQYWHTYALGYLAIMDEGQVEKAVAHLESLRTQKKNLDPDLQGRVLNGLGITYEMNEQWDQALKCYQEVIEYYEINPDDFGLGKVLINLAIVQYKGQDYEAAVASAQRSIDLLKQKPDEEDWQNYLAYAWNELGLAKMQLGDLQMARDALETSLQIATQWHNSYSLGFINTNLGHIYRQLNDLSAAKTYYQAGRDTSLEIDNQFEVAEAIYGLGLVDLAGKNFEQAHALFDESLHLATTINNHEITTHVHLSRAELYEIKGDKTAALDETRQAVETVESLRANIYIPEERTRLQGSRIEAYEKMVARLCRLGTATACAEAFQYAEMAKSRALIETLAGQSIQRPENIPLEWMAHEKQLRGSLRELYQAPEANRSEIEQQEANLDGLRQRIRLRNAEFESFQTVAPISLDEVMSLLPNDGVLLEYFTFDDMIIAFTITSSDIKITPLPLRLQDLKRITENGADSPSQLLKALTRGSGYYLSKPWILEKLYQVLLEPLGNIVWSASLLCIVPHGPLHYIPFHALYQKTASGPKYFAGEDDHPRQIIYVPSATTLFSYCQNKPLSRQSDCLAVGYNDQSVALTQAEAEADRVIQVVGGESNTGLAANRDSLLSKAQNYRYLHISCHGWFNPTWPMASTLSLADGPLDVADILQELRLEADMVTLSACETGRSHILQGDELVGLVRAFLYAGTPSVLVSHWMVDDFVTRLFMVHFYQELLALDNQTEVSIKAKALSKTQTFLRTLTVDKLREILLAEGMSTTNIDNQLQILAQSDGYDSIQGVPGDSCLLAHPYYWAAFFLVGDRLG